MVRGGATVTWVPFEQGHELGTGGPKRYDEPGGKKVPVFKESRLGLRDQLNDIIRIPIGRIFEEQRKDRGVGDLKRHLQKRMDTLEHWFEHIGKWALAFGYFIPGVRHLTAIAAGSSGFPFPVFAKYAYGGALLWTETGNLTIPRR